MVRATLISGLLWLGDKVTPGTGWSYQLSKLQGKGMAKLSGKCCQKSQIKAYWPGLGSVTSSCQLSHLKGDSGVWKWAREAEVPWSCCFALLCFLSTDGLLWAASESPQQSPCPGIQTPV